MKLGRRPFCTSPYSVNWDTTSTAPCTSASARFILPSASPNTRRPSSLSAIQASVSAVSEGANPARTRNPTPILPVTLPLTRTSARETRCRTILTAPTPPLMRSAECGMRNCRAEVDPASSLRGSTVARSIPHSAFDSLDRDTLREISRLVHIAPPPHRDVIRKQLQRQHREHGRQQIERLRNLDLLVGELRDACVPLGHDGDDPAA